MSLSRSPAALDTLQRQIRQIEIGGRLARGALPFGIPALDERLPGGGLATGALHEVAGGANGALDGAAAAGFAASVFARASGPVLWCLRQRDLFAPALAQVGLTPDRVIFAEAGDEASVLAAMEEGLRYKGLAGVVGEVAKLSMTASRRLQLAAERNGQLAIAIRRWRRVCDAADFGQPTAATTRWRVTAQPSTPLPVAGVGRPRWLLELIRSKSGECLDLVVEAPDGSGHLRLPSVVVDRPLQARPGKVRAAA